MRVLAALALAAPARTLSAQEAELLQRIEALRSELGAAASAVEDVNRRAATEAAAARRALTTTVRIGPFRVMALQDQIAVAAELFESVWREDFYAVAGSPSLERSIFTFDWWRTRPAEVHLVATMDTEDLVVRRVEIARSWVPMRESLRSHVRDAVWAALRDDLPPGSPMRGWLGNARYVRHEDAYRELAIMGSGVSRWCLAGDIQACSATLWLVPPEPARLSDWFTPRQRQTMVRRATHPWNARADPRDTAVLACVERDDIASCDAVLARIGWAEGTPVRSEVLVSALWYAVSVGGDGAWRRAIENSASTPTDVLERASGRGVQALIADWRTFLLDHRPATHAGAGRSAAAAFLWIVVFAGFAMRSTRWRFA